MKPAHLIFLLLTCASCRSIPETPEGVRVEAVDKEATERIFGTPVIETLVTGLDWSEGPLVLPSGEVIFSDVPRNHIVAWNGRRAGKWLDNSGGAADDYSREPGSNGLALTADNHLLLCQHGSRRVARMDAPLDRPRPSYVTVADRYRGKRFNSPNDLVVAADGSVLFTDPPYGLPDSSARELDFCGVYRVDPRGNVSLLTAEYSRPNGIGLSPDGRTLYLANSDPRRAVVTAHAVEDGDFRLGAARILFDGTSLTATLPGLPDGLAVARSGLVFATSPGGVRVLTPEGGVLTWIHCDRPVANVALSPAEDYLYLTNDDRLLRIKLNTP
jgi:gluconolactonase